MFHDGIYTYLDFGDKSDVIEKPTVRMVLDEIDTPITYTIIGPKDNIYAIQAIGDFTLRAAGKLVCVIFSGADLYKKEPDQLLIESLEDRAEAGSESSTPAETPRSSTPWASAETPLSSSTAADNSAASGGVYQKPGGS